MAHGNTGNKYAVGNNGGRPPIFESPDDLQSACDQYFEYIKGEYEDVEKEVTSKGKIKTVKERVWSRFPEFATITGLCLYLGFSDRGTLDDYGKKSEFSHIVKRARMNVEFAYETKLHGDKNTGAIFALKNMGWRDKTETGFTDNAGNDVKPVIQFIPATNCDPISE